MKEGVIMANMEDMTPGTIFNFDGATWKIESNNGFMLSAENTDPESERAFIQWIGNIEGHLEEVEIIERGLK